MKNLEIMYLTLIFLLIVQPISLSLDYKESNALPSSFSWTNVEGIDYTTSIKDQSPVPTCETYALCASLETIMQYQSRDAYQPDLSEAHLFYYAGGTYERGGVRVQDAAQYLIDYGVPDEGCFPDPHRPYDFLFESIVGWENRTVKIQEFGWIPHDEELIKQALIEYGPLTICINVYEDMYDYHSGVYHRSPNSPRVGGHLVALVGYDDETQSWLVKNSWGSSWGDNGWFHMGYDFDLFIDGCYGGESGVMYIDGVYGNFKPDVPKIQITKPLTFHSYLCTIEFPQFIRNIQGFQTGAPRIFGMIDIAVDAENTEKIEFYLDGNLKETDSLPPFSWNMKTSTGLHVIETIAYKGQDISKDIIDVYVLL
jgi:papain like protease